MDEELEVLRQYVEGLGLHEKDSITSEDQKQLCDSLSEADEDTLAKYIANLGDASALHDLIVNTLYG